MNAELWRTDRTFPALAGVDHFFVDLPGLRMHMAEAGSGEPVLLLHGLPQHWREWRGIVSLPSQWARLT